MSLSLFNSALLISLPHWFYAFIWLQPKRYINFSKTYLSLESHPVDTMALIATILKPIQFLSFIFWYIGTGAMNNLYDLSIWSYLLFIILFGIGQILNAGIYKAVGKDGVYYGIKLGKKIPWCTGFPFNVVAHPQYVGSVLTAWAVFYILYTPLHAIGLQFFSIYIPLLYTITGYIESNY